MRKALIAGVIISLAAAGSVAAKERRSPPGKIIGNGQQQANKIIGNAKQESKIIGNGKQASKIIGNGSTAENRKRDSLKSAGFTIGNR